jgi:hypothetical protein
MEWNGGRGVGGGGRGGEREREREKKEEGEGCLRSGGQRTQIRMFDKTADATLAL